MFGFTKVTPEEKAELDKKKRISELQKALHEQTVFRQESLKKSEALRDELEKLNSSD